MRPANSPLSPDAGARIDQYLAGLGLGFNPALLRRERSDQIARLEALSDRALLARGLHRRDIPRHVFRDLFP
ncbi:hypothetical protein ACFQXB_04045 [Plastorhodobacter daqingensis]|uniref:DUF1127 domain-containing protein n=1 Tax=Plastorhodobacter daqingensis TaxID=1387281 RepID=A0ABW2UIY3_9RHOB